jgi:exopolysaccharide production protein ExoQ
MPPKVALGLTIALIVWLFRRDKSLRQLPSPALWIPAAWLFMVGTRSLTIWLGDLGVPIGGTTDAEGNPIDMVVLLGLMLAALLVLNRRGFDWAAFVRENKVLIVIYLYLATSALWSEQSFPTLKRTFKDFGCVLAGLVLLTESNPLDAMRTVYVRLAYLLFPLSVVFIKYFPEIGRATFRGGDSMFVGVCTHKNTLGLVVFVFSLFVVVDLWMLKRRPRQSQRTDVWIRYGLLGMAVWLLLTCESRTSLLCLILGCLLLWGTGRLLQARDPKRIVYRLVGVVVALVVLENAFDLSGLTLEALGRDRTLTGRTAIWESVRQTHPDPVFGCGFYSFWGTEAARTISKEFKGTLKTIHNGLLEMYVDGGVIGLSLLILLLLVWARTSFQRMLEGTIRGRMTVTFWVLAVIYNFSETNYFRLDPLWFTLLALMIECPPLRQPKAAHAPAESSPVLEVN